MWQVVTADQCTNHGKLLALMQRDHEEGMGLTFVNWKKQCHELMLIVILCYVQSVPSMLLHFMAADHFSSNEDFQASSREL